MITLKILLALVTIQDLNLKQMDVKTTFAHGDFYEKVYKQHSKGFVEKGREKMVC